MARRVVVDCDRCGKLAEPVLRISPVVGRKPDGAGGMEDEVEEVDLCVGCAELVLAKFISQMDHEAARVLAKACHKKRR